MNQHAHPDGDNEDPQQPGSPVAGNLATLLVPALLVALLLIIGTAVTAAPSH